MYLLVWTIVISRGSGRDCDLKLKMSSSNQGLSFGSLESVPINPVRIPKHAAIKKEDIEHILKWLKK